MAVLIGAANISLALDPDACIVSRIGTEVAVTVVRQHQQCIATVIPADLDQPPAAGNVRRDDRARTIANGNPMKVQGERVIELKVRCRSVNPCIVNYET